jgi:hypothetical protein
MSDLGHRNSSSAATIGRKVGHELLEYGLISAYLYVCFGALIFYKVAILRGHGIDIAPYGLAAIKALVLGKFIPMGHAARMGDHYERRRFIHVVAYKSTLFLVMLLVLTFIEEAVVGVIHGRTIGESLADVAGGTLPEIVASSVIMLLILIPYVTVRELNAVLGKGNLRQILLGYRSGYQSGSR